MQTDDHIMILIEMVHDARIVRMKSEGRPVAHLPAGEKKWLGDSIGWWEGDTLVVDTTNFEPQSSMRGGSENTHVVERFMMQPDGNLVYRFTVEDDTVWSAPWTVSTSGGGATNASTSTPATKATTRSATSCAELESWRRTLWKQRTDRHGQGLP